MWRGWRLSKSGSGHSGWARWATQAGGKAAHSGADAPLGLPGRGECELWGEGGLLTALGGTNWPWGHGSGHGDTGRACPSENSLERGGTP